MSDTQMNLVSVIIPVYNGASYLKEAIDSALAQTHRSVEVIAVDDGSTDASPQILAGYEDRIFVLRQSNSGVTAARNAGIRESRGEFVAFLDQDDYWYPGKLERQLQEFREDPEVGFVHSEVQHFDDVRKTPVERFNECRSDLLVGNCHERLLLGNGIFNSSVAVRHSVLKKAGFFDAQVCGNTVQDYDLWLRCARLTKFAHCPEKLALYRLHPNQGMWNVKNSHAQLVQMLERHVGPACQVESRELRRHFHVLFSQLGIEHLDSREKREARAYLRRALRLGWSSKNAVIYATSFMPNFMIDAVRLGRSYFRLLFGEAVQSKVPVWTGRVNNGV